MESSPSKSSPTKRKRKIKDINSNLSKDELIRRLKAAAQELSNVDQGEDTTEYNEFAVSIASSFILNHKDKDVRSFAACCLADVLRIFAPLPPYNDEELKDIFRMIVNQLKHLENVQGPAYKRHFYILESLALVKTFNVCMEFDAQDIILDLFKLFFTIVSEEHNVRVKNFMLDVMCPLIQEGDSLPQELLDVILVSLIDPRKTKSPESYQLACSLLDRCSSSIEPYIQLFFNNTIVLGNSVSPEMDNNLYELLYELYKINKNVLLSVLPQLEFKLKGNDEGERLETVKLLGRMFADEESSLAESNKPLWNCYLGRFLDVSPGVRLECVQMAKQFLLSSEGVLRADITEQLVNRLQDPDEKVRLETVITICESAVENFSLIHDKLFNGVVDRIRDKKWVIRREAVTCIGQLYKRILSNKKSPKKALKRISDVPSKILHLYFQNSLDDRLCIERVVHGCLIPVTLPVEERMKRLFNLYYSLDDAATSVFDGMLKHRARVNKDFVALLEAYKSEEPQKNLEGDFFRKRKRGADELNKPEQDEAKEKVVFTKTVTLARSLPEPYKAQEHLTKLMTMCTSKTFYELLCTCADDTEECPKIIKAVTEIIKTITAKNPILETVKSLLDRACPMIIDSSSFTHLLKNIKDYIDGYGDEDEEDDADILMKGKCGLKLVEILATVQPTLFQSRACYEVLMLFITHKEPEIVERALKILQNVMTGIGEVDKALSGSFQPVLTKLITQGSCKQAKYALRCVRMLNKDSSIAMERLHKSLVEKLNFVVPSEKLRSTLAALAELAILSPDIFERTHTKIIRDFAVKEILMIDKEKTSHPKEDEDEWGPDDQVSDETLTKIEAIKLLTRWLMGMTSTHAENAKPVFRLLTTLLNNDGDLKGEGKISAVNRSRLRVVASVSLLKLLQNVKYVDVITLEQYQQLALIIQDSCFEVREKFTMKLHRALDSLKLSLDYLAYLSLVAVDPSKERKAKVKQMIARSAQTRRDFSKLHSAVAARPYAILPEYSLPYVVHLLAHHPDFKPTDIDSLQQTKDYLWYFLEPIMGPKAENYSFLKKLLENIKQTKDQQDPDNEETNMKMYTVCDVAIGCVMNKNQIFTLKDFPGNLVLPRKLFLPDKTLNNTKSYIPADLFAQSKQKPQIETKAAVGKSKSDDMKTDVKEIPTSKKNGRSAINDEEEEKSVSSRKKARLKKKHEDDVDSDEEAIINTDNYQVRGTRSRPAQPTNAKQTTVDKYFNGNSKSPNDKSDDEASNVEDEESSEEASPPRRKTKVEASSSTSKSIKKDDTSDSLNKSSTESSEEILESLNSSQTILQVKRKSSRRR